MSVTRPPQDTPLTPRRRAARGFLPPHSAGLHTPHTTPEHYRKLDSPECITTTPSHRSSLREGGSKGSQNGETYLSSFGKSVSLERRSRLKTCADSETESNGHQWRSFSCRGTSSVPASPRRIPPPSPTTPSLWKKIFSFSRKSASSSERDLSDVGRSSTVPSFRERMLHNRSTVYSEYDMEGCKDSEDSPSRSVSRNSSICGDTPTPIRRGSGPRLARVVNRLISDLKQSTTGEDTPSKSYHSYRRSCSDSKATGVLKDNGGDNEDEKALLGPLSPESRRKAASVMDINGNDSDRDTETVVRVRRYRCLPSPVHRQLSGTATPPIVRFSSDEDITSTHSQRGSVSDRNSMSDDNLLGEEGSDQETRSDKLLDKSGDESDIRLVISEKNRGDMTHDKTKNGSVHTKVGDNATKARITRVKTNIRNPGKKDKDANYQMPRKSQSQRASSPVQWVKHRYRHSKSRTPSPGKVCPEKSNTKDNTSGHHIKKTSASSNRVKTSEPIAVLVKQDRKATKTKHKDKFCDSSEVKKEEAKNNVKKSLHKPRSSKSRTPSPLKVCSERASVKSNIDSKSIKVASGNNHKLKRSEPKSSSEQPIDPAELEEMAKQEEESAAICVSEKTEQKDNVKTFSHQMSHPPPTIKPRPKVKRSVSYSPGRQAATISAELEERIGRLLREPPASRRRESTGGMVPTARTQGHLAHRLPHDHRARYTARRCNSLANESVTLDGRPSLLRHYSGNSDTNTKTSPHGDRTCQGINNVQSEPKGTGLQDLQETSDAAQFGKSCDHSKGSSFHDDQSSSFTLPKKEFKSNHPKGSKRSLAFTRHRHHTIEIGRDVATAKYMEAYLKAGGLTSNPNRAAAANTDSNSSEYSGSQVPRCKHSIDQDPLLHEKSSSKTTRALVSKGERSDSYTLLALKSGSLRRQGPILYTTPPGNKPNDKTGSNFQSSLFLHLDSSLDKDEGRVDTSGSKHEAAGKKKLSCNETNKTKRGCHQQMRMESESVQNESVQSESDSRGVTSITSDTNFEESKVTTNESIKEDAIVEGDTKAGKDTKDNISGDHSLNKSATDSVDKTDGTSEKDADVAEMNTHNIVIQVTGAQEISPEYEIPSCVEIRVSRSPVNSPERKHKERPKSEILSVKWADESEILGSTEWSGLTDENQKRKRTRKERPKSELGGRQLLAEALRTQTDIQDGGGSDSSSIHQSHLAAWDKTRLRQRRMSTPHPIKMRPSVSSDTSVSEEAPGSSSCVIQLLNRMKRCRSAPSLEGTAGRRRRYVLFQASSAHAGDLALQPIEFTDTSDDELTSEETASLGGHSLASSGSGGRHAIDQLFEEEAPTFAEALWDHVTLDVEELAFQVGEVIRVTDRLDKDWWYGVIEDRMGWFPAAFVRLHANQMNTADDFVSKMKAGHMTNTMALQRYSSSLLSKEQARTNVVREIVNAEREYVKHLKDVVEGYVEKARKRPEMFPDSMLTTIFSNIEEIYKFSSHFLQTLDAHLQPGAPHLSEIGKCFLVNRHGFEIYSEYCNNHPMACDELRSLQKNQKYKHFFEACRLLQQMIEIPLEGFLLTPVQKICKYPLQLKELLKYTRPEHPDCRNLQEALESMRHIAMLINERKRKLESLEKLAEWQGRVEDWEGSDLISQSSELIHSGEMTKVNTNGWHQERVFFLFDYQILYCKKDLLWRDLLIYRGRINLDHCEVHSIQDGKDVVYNTVVKNGLKIYDRDKDKWYLMYCKTSEQKDKWLNAFQQERHRVMLDRANGFNLDEYRSKVRQTYLKSNFKKEKKKPHSPKDVSYKLPSQRQMSTTEALQYAHSHDKKTGLLPFLKRKIKR